MNEGITDEAVARKRDRGVGDGLSGERDLKGHRRLRTLGRLAVEVDTPLTKRLGSFPTLRLYSGSCSTLSR